MSTSNRLSSDEPGAVTLSVPARPIDCARHVGRDLALAGAAPISAPPSVRMPVRSSSAWRLSPFSPANHYSGIDPRIVASVRHHTRRASGRLSGMELEDLEQELMLHAHRRLSSYDPERADLWTYADRILSNFVANLAKAAGARSRGGGASTVSLDDPKLELDREPIATAICDRCSADLSWCERIHLRQDLDRVLNSLPQHLQECCHWLARGSVTEAARRSGLARGSIYSRIATLKRAFAVAGLDAYLACPSPTLSNSTR